MGRINDTIAAIIAERDAARNRYDECWTALCNVTIERDRMRELLRECQIGRYCPICDGLRGQCEKDCRLAAALKGTP